MIAAKEWLIKTDLSISEIANSVGYSDILAFSKAFSLNEKMSPQKYRLLARKNTNLSVSASKDGVV